MLVCLSVGGSAQKVSNASKCGVWREDQFLRCPILSSKGAFVNDCAMQNPSFSTYKQNTDCF